MAPKAIDSLKEVAWHIAITILKAGLAELITV